MSDSNPLGKTSKGKRGRWFFYQCFDCGKRSKRSTLDHKTRWIAAAQEGFAIGWDERVRCEKCAPQNPTYSIIRL